MKTLSSLNISSSIAELRASLTVIWVGLLSDEAFLIEVVEEVKLKRWASFPSLSKEGEDREGLLGRDKREEEGVEEIERKDEGEDEVKQVRRDLEIGLKEERPAEAIVIEVVWWRRIEDGIREGHPERERLRG